MDGVVLVDKNYGPTSQQVSLWVAEILGEKTCHCGTLDPMATGVLPVLIGRGVKLQEFLQKHDKEYIAAIELEPFPPVERVKSVALEFTGKVYQTPPSISAVAKITRVRRIYWLDVLEAVKPFLLIRVCCEHGFYVRKLAEDIGMVLGARATLVALRRTRVNDFREEECVSLTKLKDTKECGKMEQAVLPLEEAVRGLPKAFLKPGAVENVIKGAPLYAPGVEKFEGGFPRNAPLAYMRDAKLVGIGITVSEMREAREKKKGVIAKTRKVLVNR